MSCLANHEQARLAALESTIQAGIDTFHEVGMALLEVRDRRLWRGGEYESFVHYCQVRWGYAKSHAYRLVEAAEVIQDLSPTGENLPANERQLRALAQVKDPDARREVWQKAVETGQTTGAEISRLAADEEVNRIAAKALAGLSSEQRVADIQRHERNAVAQQAKDERDRRIDRTLSLIGRAVKEAGGLGGEADETIGHLEAAKKAAHALQI